MSSSIGLPGSILFMTPSSPAISIAEKARYGFAVPSGHLNSSRFVFGFLEYIGILTAALLFRFEYARLTGASYPGTNLLYEIVVGFVNARSEGACLRSPPI